MAPHFNNGAQQTQSLRKSRCRKIKVLWIASFVARGSRQHGRRRHFNRMARSGSWRQPRFTYLRCSWPTTCSTTDAASPRLLNMPFGRQEVTINISPRSNLRKTLKLLSQRPNPERIIRTHASSASPPTNHLRSEVRKPGNLGRDYRLQIERSLKFR